MLNKLKTNWKITLVAAWAFIMASVFLMGVGGCSTVSGFAQDLGSVSDGFRDAMVEQKKSDK